MGTRGMCSFIFFLNASSDITYSRWSSAPRRRAGELRLVSVRHHELCSYFSPRFHQSYSPTVSISLYVYYVYSLKYRTQHSTHSPSEGGLIASHAHYDRRMPLCSRSLSAATPSPSYPRLRHTVYRTVLVAHFFFSPLSYFVQVCPYPELAASYIVSLICLSLSACTPCIPGLSPLF